MEILIDNLRNVLAFIFVIGVLVFVHELGHFVVAKLNKMHVYQFCIGFGPKLIKYQGKETTYAICLLPLGGMVDLREDENDATNTRSFSSKKPYQRFLTIIAGATMNFVLAYIIIVGIFLPREVPTTTIGELAPGLPAVIAGIEVGDEIVSINGDKIKIWTDVSKNVAFSDETTFEVIVERNNELLTFNLTGQISDGYMKIGVSPTYEKSVWLSFRYGAMEFMDKSTMIFDAFTKLITGKLGADQIAGPVGIYKQVGEVASTRSFADLLYFTALLSINLGIFNLLPFPFLDGGRAVFILYEMIVRKPIDKEKEAFVHFMGMVALVILMVVLIFKDLVM